MLGIEPFITAAIYRSFYFRPRKIFAITGQMLTHPRVVRRRLAEGIAILRFLTARRRN